MNKLTDSQTKELLIKLKTRFEKNMNRHPNHKWSDIETKLTNNTQALQSLFQMEETNGEPDLVDLKLGELTFIDCSIETPLGRRNTCYDNEALVSRKKFPPENSAIEMAKSMGIELLTEEQYKSLQTLGQFDLKTSSWILTPSDIRKLGGALFCDNRYNKVFTYHNGADSYYSSRGFRGILKI